MDMSMPVMNGLAATETIKNSLPLKHLPKIILLTSYSGEEASQGSVSVAFDGILVKPVSRSLLFNTIMEAFGNGRGVVSHNEFSQGDALLLARERLSGAYALLAEDNDINQEIAVELMEQAGLRVDVACNGLEAVRAAQTTDYDVILMDIQMPEMDGLEAAAAIRNQDTPWAKEVAILAMTAHALVGDREKSLESGMNAHIVKPIDPDELYEALLRWTRPPRSADAADGVDDMTPADAVPLADDLPGLSVSFGLRRVAGNNTLYGNLLRRFRAANVDFFPQIRQALDRSDTQTALEMAHTLKGVAGNLGAAELSDAAAALETLLKKGESTGLDQALQTLQACFLQVMDSIALLQPEEPETGAKGANGAPPNPPRQLDTQAVLTALDTFEQLLEEDLGEAQDCLEKLHALVRGSALEPGCKALQDALDVFESDVALAKCRELREALQRADAVAAQDAGEEPAPGEAASEPEIRSEAVAGAETLPPAQAADVVPVLQQMADSLEDDLVECLAGLEKLGPMLKETPGAPLLQELTGQLDRFDTDAARNTLEAMARMLGGTLREV